jgi:tetratricopeptide (TPR) repeat protein
VTETAMAAGDRLCWGGGRGGVETEGGRLAGFAFISHSSRDADYVGRLAYHLRRAGLTVWVGDASLRHRDRWEEAVRARIDACAAMIVVMSPAAEAAPHVAGEIERARAHGRPILRLLLAGEPFFALGGVYDADARDGALPGPRFVQRLTDLITGPAADPAAATPGWPGQTVIGNLPAAAPAWRDRPAVLARLAAADHDAQPAVLWARAGQHGVGKTQLAAAYARMRVRQGWPVVVWAAAATETGIVTALDALATAVGVRAAAADRHAAATTALHWLRDQPGPSLLVYDDAADGDLIRRWLPATGPVQVVVTTTRLDLTALGGTLDVTIFDPAEATDYLTERTGLDDPAGAQRLTAAVGRLPLTLALTGALIGPGRICPGYEAYLSRLSDGDPARLLPLSAVDPYPRGVAEAVTAGLDELAGADPREPARRLLEHLAVLAPTGVDGRLLRLLCGPDDPDLLTGALTERALAAPGAATDRLVVHRLVQAVLRDGCRRAGTLDERVVAAADQVSAAAGRVGGRWADRAALLDLAAHATALSAHAGGERARRHVLNLRAELMFGMRAAHDTVAAVSFGAALVADQAQAYGPDHPDVLRSRHNLANAYQDAGRLPVAIALHQRNAGDFARLLGPTHPDTLISRNNLANAYQQAGRTDEAIRLHEHNLADLRSARGAEDPGTLASRHNLAIASQAAGRIDAAIRLFEENLAVRERVLGAGHPDALSSRHELALAFQEAGRANLAVPLHERNVSDRERTLGRDHPDTLRSRHGLARALLSLRRLDAAVPLLERVAGDAERLLGGDHPDTIRARNTLANAYLHAGRAAEAVTLHERNLADQRRILGTDHPGLLVTCANLAGAYESAGRAADALALCHSVLAEQDRLGRGSRPEALRLRMRLDRVARLAPRRGADSLPFTPAPDRDRGHRIG